MSRVLESMYSKMYSNVDGKKRGTAIKSILGSAWRLNMHVLTLSSTAELLNTFPLA
jgi:hypothetical protein